MATHKTIVRQYLRDFAELGVNFWMTQHGWYWSTARASWLLNQPAPIRGPYASAFAAGQACAQALDLPTSGEKGLPVQLKDATGDYAS